MDNKITATVTLNTEELQQQLQDMSEAFALAAEKIENADGERSLSETVSHDFEQDD
jgi:hypothetical protein